MKLSLEIGADGSITLPDELLQHLGINPGDQIEVIELPHGGIEFRAAKPSDPVDDLFRYARDER